MPFLDGDDVMAGAAIEAALRNGRKLEFSAEELAAFLERAPGDAAAAALALRLRQALTTLLGGARARRPSGRHVCSRHCASSAGTARVRCAATNSRP